MIHFWDDWLVFVAPQMPKPFQKEVLEEFFTGVEDLDDGVHRIQEASLPKSQKKTPVVLAAHDEAALNLMALPEARTEFERVSLGERAAQASTVENQKLPASGNVQFTMSASDESDLDTTQKGKPKDSGGRGEFSKSSRSGRGRGSDRGRGGGRRGSIRGRGNRGRGRRGRR